MSRLAKSRFNPAPGALDFWNEFRKPNPWRLPTLLVSMAPFGIILWWLSGETLYKDPERPTITYITTFDPARTDAQIAATNAANQEVKDLREADRLAREERKRELYKALGAAAGMDVEEIDRRAREERAAEAAQQEAEIEAAREALQNGAQPAPDPAPNPAPNPAPDPESPAP